MSPGGQSKLSVRRELKSKYRIYWQDGGGVRHGDHLPPHRYIRNTSTRGIAPIEHPLNAGKRRQTSQKARNSPGGVKEKRNNRDKRIVMGPAPVGGSSEGGKVSTH